MKLTYRGVDYEYTPLTSKTGEAIVTGKYRGSAVEFKSIAEIPEQPIAVVMWRGVSYQSGYQSGTTPLVTPEPSEVTPTVAQVSAPTPSVEPTNPVTTMARNLFIRHHQNSRKREQAMMTRLAVEVGIPVDVAAHYESQIQGKLPHDFAGYDRSNAAMS